MSSSFDAGVAAGVNKIAAYGPHVDAAVRELRARGHDRAAAALLGSAGPQARGFREAKAVARIARIPGMSPVVLKGVTQAVSDKPGMWDTLVRTTEQSRRSQLSGYARDLIHGKLDPVPRTAAHELWKPRTVVKNKMSTKAKVGLGLAGLLAAYGAYRATAPQRYEDARV